MQKIRFQIFVLMFDRVAFAHCQPQSKPTTGKKEAVATLTKAFSDTEDHPQYVLAPRNYPAPPQFKPSQVVRFLTYFFVTLSNTHVALADLVKIFHPELLPQHQFVYYKKLTAHEATH